MNANKLFNYNRTTVTKKESTDGISINSAVEGYQAIESDDSTKLDSTDEAKSKSSKINEAHHIEVRYFMLFFF